MIATITITINYSTKKGKHPHYARKELCCRVRHRQKSWTFHASPVFFVSYKQTHSNKNLFQYTSVFFHLFRALFISDNEATLQMAVPLHYPSSPQWNLPAWCIKGDAFRKGGRKTERIFKLCSLAVRNVTHRVCKRNMALIITLAGTPIFGIPGVAWVAKLHSCAKQKCLTFTDHFPRPGLGERWWVERVGRIACRFCSSLSFPSWGLEKWNAEAGWV